MYFSSNFLNGTWLWQNTCYYYNKGWLYYSVRLFILKTLSQYRHHTSFEVRLPQIKWTRQTTGLGNTCLGTWGVPKTKKRQIIQRCTTDFPIWKKWNSNKFIMIPNGWYLTFILFGKATLQMECGHSSPSNKWKIHIITFWYQTQSGHY